MLIFMLEVVVVVVVTLVCVDVAVVAVAAAAAAIAHRLRTTDLHLPLHEENSTSLVARNGTLREAGYMRAYPDKKQLLVPLYSCHAVAARSYTPRYGLTFSSA